MATISQEQLRQLVSRGYTIEQIRAISTKPQAVLLAALSKNSPTPNRLSTSLGTVQQPQGSFQARDPFTGGPARDPFTGTTQAPTFGGGGSTLFKMFGIDGGDIGSGVGKIASAIVSGANTGKKILEQLTSSKQRDVGKTRVTGKAGVNSAAAQQAAMEDFSLDPYIAPTLEYRDFTDQAKGQVGDIYSPRYAAIDAAMERAKQNYGRSRQVVGGLYENLAKSVAQTAEDTKARYGQAAAQQAAATQETAQNVGQTYASTQNQEANLLRQLGQEEAAKDVLSDNSADSAWQQGQVNREGLNQQGAISSQGNAQQDYLANLSDAHQTGGAVAQQDLLNQLANVNAGYEQDRFNLQGDQAQAALSLAQQLADRDFQAQSQNAQLGAQAYGFNNQNQQWSQEQNFRQQQAAIDQQNQAAQMRMALEQMRLGQMNSDRDYGLNQAKYTTDLATTQAQLGLEQQKLNPGEYQGLAVNDQDPTTRTLTQITSALGGDAATAKKYYDFVQQATNAFASQGLDAASIIGSQFSYVSEIGRQAEAKGLNPVVAQAAASAVWQNYLKGQGK